MKTTKTLVYWMLSTFIITSCSAQQNPNTDACVISKNVESNSQLIKSKNLKSILAKSKDNCNLRLVDSIYATFLREGNKLGFEFLTSIANQSDGYLSEYIVEKMGKIYFTKFESFFNFLYEDFSNKRKNELALFLVDCWSSIAATSDNATIAIAKIRKNTQSIVGKQQSDLENRMKYLNTLLEKINAKYLD